MYDIIYIISSTVTVLAFMFSVYYYKRFCISCITALFLLMIAQVAFTFIPIIVSDVIYDVAIIAVSMCIIRNAIIGKVVKIPCPLSDTCDKNPHSIK